MQNIFFTYRFFWVHFKLPKQFFLYSFEFLSPLRVNGKAGQQFQMRPFFSACCFGLFILAAGLTGRTQVFMEYMSNAKGIDASVVIYGSENFGNRIPYNKISGSPFWNNDWQLAALYSEDNREKWLMKTKLNLAAGEVYFINKSGEEQVAPGEIIKTIVFYKNFDTAQAAAVFRYKYGETCPGNKGKNYFVQIMNRGNCQLLKLERRPVASADSLFHTLKRYFFSQEVKYFIQSNNKTGGIKKLSREHILAYLPHTAAFNEWIEQNKINFKKEEDIVRFIDYYNSKK